jgi:hypothetical protein
MHERFGINLSGTYKVNKIPTEYENIKEGIYWEKLVVLHRANLF